MYVIRSTAAQQADVLADLELDRIHLDVHGHGVGILSNVADTVNSVREGYHFFEADDPVPGSVDFYSLSRDGPGYEDIAAALFPDGPTPPHCLVVPAYERLYGYASLVDLNYGTGSLFTSELVAGLYDRYHVFHAAALTNGRRGVLFPAALRGGKSSLTLGLLNAGFDFASDDLAFVHRESLTVAPYPRQINVRLESLYHVPGIDRDYDKMRFGMTYTEPRWFLDKSDKAAAPFPLDFVVFPQFDAVTRLAPLSKAEAALRLLRASVLPVTPRLRFEHTAENLDLISRLLDGAETFSLAIGRVSDALALLTDLLGPGRRSVTIPVASA